MVTEMAKYRQEKKRIQDELMKYPNVLQISIGTKEVKGKDTGEYCYTVLVKRKVPKSRLDPNEIIPSELDGLKTDVVPVETEVGYRGTTTFVILFAFVLMILLSTTM
ncbi:MAG: hypothetical protein HWN67_01295 [Candidatus Helarchaeota archaeon]|nr:hypothetical protein [Candidatus Helarchaeota archaeon]